MDPVSIASISAALPSVNTLGLTAQLIELFHQVDAATLSLEASRSSAGGLGQQVRSLLKKLRDVLRSGLPLQIQSDVYPNEDLQPLFESISLAARSLGLLSDFYGDRPLSMRWPLRGSSAAPLTSDYQAQSLTEMFANVESGVDRLIETLSRHNVQYAIGESRRDDTHVLQLEGGADAASWRRSVNTENFFVIATWWQEFANTIHLRNNHELTLASSQWLMETDSFEDWLAEDNRVLWILGKPGCGKSTLASACVNHLTTQEHSVAYYFFGLRSAYSTTTSFLRAMTAQLFISMLYGGHDRPIELRTELDQGESDGGAAKHHLRRSSSTLSLRTLQLLQSSGANRKQFYDAVGSRDLLDLSSNVMALLDLLVATIKVSKKFHFVVDGLDECSDPEDLSECLRVLSGTPGVSLFITSRPSTLSKRSPFEWAQRRGRKLDLDASQSENMHNYISEQVVRDKKLSRLNGAMQERITRLVERRASGMFLEAKLLLKEFSGAPTTREIVRILTNLEINSSPLGLDQLYDRVYEEMTRNSSGHLERVLLWIAGCKRPLTVAELAEACIINPDNLDFDDRLLAPEEIPADCAPFVMVHQPIERSIRINGKSTNKTPVASSDKAGLACVSHFIHQSVREYLLQRWSSRSQHEFLFDYTPSQYLSRACLSYLLEVGQHESDAESLKAQYPFVTYCAENWVHHAREEPSSTLDSVLQRFFSEPKPFLLWLRLSGEERETADNEDIGLPFLKWAAKLGFDSVVHYLLQESQERQITSSHIGTALVHAVVEGHADVVKTLLSFQADPRFCAAHDYPEECPLTLASSKGHKSIVEVLIAALKPNPAAHDIVMFGKALHVAVVTGSTEIVMALYNGADIPDIINFQDPNTNSTALHLAAKNKDEDMKNLLLELGGNIDLKNLAGISALELSFRQSNKVYRWADYTLNEQLTSVLDSAGQARVSVLSRDPAVKETNERYETIFCKEFDMKHHNKQHVEETRKYLLREHNLLQKLDHPNVIECLGFEDDREHAKARLYLEYANGRSLTPYTNNPPCSLVQTLPQLDAWYLLFQLAAALAYLHHGLTVGVGNRFTLQKMWKRILHRDIKPQNVVFHETPGREKVAKLCDLGLAKQASRALTRGSGSHGYIPPENLRRKNPQPWGIKGEIYALGATMDNLKKAGSQDGRLNELIERMCDEDHPERRPSSLSVLEEAAPRIVQGHQELSENISAFLGSYPGGYVLNMILILGNWLDDLDSWHWRSTRHRRRAVLIRLKVLCVEDGGLEIFRAEGTSLHLAVILCDRAKIEQLLAEDEGKKAINTKWPRSGWTPLHLALQAKCCAEADDIVQCLRNAGADGKIKDKHGLLPKDCKDVDSDVESLSLMDDNGDALDQVLCGIPEDGLPTRRSWPK